MIGGEIWTKEVDQTSVRTHPLYASVLQAKENQINQKKLKKCVFISHRQADAHLARNLAKTLQRNGIQFWLDVLDPNLQSTPSNNAIAIANIIEMALLNCTHVVAYWTPNAQGSGWIPYEYGRVKDRNLHIKNAAARLSNMRKSSVPEYMRIGKLFTSNTAVVNWAK